ncbi:MAG TPA: winged helix-turn-helix domain-containing protein [Roseateles sp.]
MLSTTDFAYAPGGPDQPFPQRIAVVWPTVRQRSIVHRFGCREVRPATREVRVNGECRRLQPRAFDLLMYLIEHRDRVLGMHELLDAIWPERDVQAGSLATAIARVRAVLGDPGDEIIQTHHRIGYRFVAVLDADPDESC